MRTLTFIILILSFNVSWAGYDITTWGMSLAKVKTLYPGGIVEKNQNGVVDYRVVKFIADVSTGLVTFSFPPKSGLKSVNILFPKEGTEINLKTGDLTQRSNDECTSQLKMMGDILTTKYGLPNGPQSPDNKEQKAWLTKTNDLVMLTVVRGPISCIVGIGYGKFELGKLSTEGL